MTRRESAVASIGKREFNGSYTVGKFDEVYGENVFNERVQREHLPSEAFQSLQRTINLRTPLATDIADVVAFAMKEWAIEKGATHFCHWFQPLSDITAEKHDSFFSPTGEGKALADFSGKMLIQGEPDASSFPSGGLRTTFEARGYTAWDPSSPAIIINHTLFIPTMFLSWTGDALDKKTPLLRSMEALNEQALRCLRLFGETKTKRVTSTVGAEQEYFLIDQEFFHLRPDLIATGRTLFGNLPPKSQELEDQYLGAIPPRVNRLMEEVEYELIRIGVPIKTRHNEVAPGQYELAVSYEVGNLAADHNMMLVEMLKKVARRYRMYCLLHEKPFKGVNGSGKHNNWSLATDQGENLLEPGHTPHENARFLLFCTAVIRAAHKYASILRMSIASCGNDHRLGVHEAPPAILSVFLGEQLFEIFQRLIEGKLKGSSHEKDLSIGVSMLPTIPRHSGDRNRTSPFAFTGNKFEMRSVGSDENISDPNTVLNTAVADVLSDFATELEGSDKPFNEALQELLTRSATEFMPILFEGDNYGAAWEKEAVKRGLDNITNTVDAAAFYTSRDAVALFTKYKVLSRRELVSRQEIMLSKYCKKLMIEGRSASQIVHTLIIPAIYKYAKVVGEGEHYLNLKESDLLKMLSKELSVVKKGVKKLDDLLERAPEGDIFERAAYMRERVLEQMHLLRTHVDGLETVVDDALWPLPKYHEMLFIK